MKKLLYILVLVSCNFLLKAQTPFTTPNLLTGGNTKITQNKGASKSDSGFIVAPRFTDTATANLSVVSLYGGMLIRVLDTLWMRNESANAWVKQRGGGGGGAGSVILYRTVGIDSIYLSVDGTTYAVKDSIGEADYSDLVWYVNTIAELEAYSSSATTVIVTDSLRGGIFNYYVAGLTTDDGVVFDATGKGAGYWKRQTTESDAVDIRWFGAAGDDSTTNTNILIAIIDAGLKRVYIPDSIAIAYESISDGRLDSVSIIKGSTAITFGKSAVIGYPASNDTHLSLQPLKKNKVTGLWISGKDPYPQSSDGTGTYNTLKIGWEDLEEQLRLGTDHYGDFGLTLQKEGYNGFGAARFNTKENGDFTGDWPSMEFTFQNNSPTYKAMTIALLKPIVNADASGLGYNYGGRDKAFWYAGRATTAGQYVLVNYNVYKATTTGTTGATKPVHTSGTVSDGGISWQWIENVAPNVTGVNWRPTVIFGATDDFPVVPFNDAAVHFAERSIVYPQQGFDFINGAKDAIMGSIEALSQTTKGLKFIADTATDKYVSVSDSRFKLNNVPLIPTILSKPSGDATFAVTTGDIIAFNDATATNFQQFTGGISGQVIIVNFNTANTTLIESSVLRLNNAVTINPDANTAAEFYIESSTTARLVGLGPVADTLDCSYNFVDISGDPHDNVNLDTALNNLHYAVSARVISPTGVSGRVAYFTGTNTLGTSADINADAANNRLGLLTASPTHTLTLGSTNNGIVNYNTSDQVTNYERLRTYWGSNIYTIAVENSGSGSQRPIAMSANGSIYTLGNPSKGFDFTRNGGTITSIVNIGSAVGSALTASSGDQSVLQLDATVSQTSTAGYKGLYISPFENSTGSGSKLLIDAGTNSAAQNGGTHTSKFSVDNSGNVVLNNTATSGINLYNTADRTTNYERAVFAYNSNVLEVGTLYGGSGSTRSLRLGIVSSAGSTIASGINILIQGAAPFFTFNHGSTGITGNLTSIAGTYQASSGTQSVFTLNPVFNQSGTAGYEGMAINATETALGSGTKSLFKASTGGTQRFLIDNTGAATSAGYVSLTNTSGTGYVEMANGSTPATPTSAIRVYSNAGGLSFVNSGGHTASIYASTGTASFTIPSGTNTAATLSAAETFTNKTLTSPIINTPTGIVKGDVGLGNVDNTSNATERAAAATLTNKTIDGDDNTLQDISSTSLKSTAARGYSMQGTHGSLTYTASQVYYFGGMAGNITTTAQRNKIYIPTTGTITKVYISYFNGGTLSTTETGTFAIRLNNTTDYTVTSALINDAVTKDFSNTSMSVPVTAGDYIEFKVTVGAVTTAATVVRCSVVFFVE